LSYKEKLILNIYRLYLKCMCFFASSYIFYTVRFFSFLLDHALIEKRAFLRRSAATGIAI